jgi:hypothetical protein
LCFGRYCRFDWNAHALRHEVTEALKAAESYRGRLCRCSGHRTEHAWRKRVLDALLRGKLLGAALDSCADKRERLDTMGDRAGSVALLVCIARLPNFAADALRAMVKSFRRRDRWVVIDQSPDWMLREVLAALLRFLFADAEGVAE